MVLPQFKTQVTKSQTKSFNVVLDTSQSTKATVYKKAQNSSQYSGHVSIIHTVEVASKYSRIKTRCVNKRITTVEYVDSKQPKE